MIKKGFLLLFFWILSIQSQSQEQVVWSTVLEKVSDDIYLLKFEAKIKPKWHLYSQHLPDNGPLPTEFIFKGEEGQFDLVGNTHEGKSKTAYDTIFEMELSWFDDEAFFEQKIKLLNIDLAFIEGEINYQACDDKLCIFRNEDFRFVLDKSKIVITDKKVIDY
ncbi:MAG: thiol:disulfide interchange protein, partial [Flavobacteriaceae bacterium]|nr:thiol:disulfide interchange protein [Flavobacteriaceae bacterium]